ncbi:hypothetical protein GQ600_25715 [Phytophthora cactorum]|nr:hypothetical protein GQ600_25715 [Phytophthora cactorum]
MNCAGTTARGMARPSTLSVLKSCCRFSESSNGDAIPAPLSNLYPHASGVYCALSLECLIHLVIPGVLLVATLPSMLLAGPPRSLRSNVDTIRLNKGDMIILRGDFIYSTYLGTPSYLSDLEGTEPNIVAVIEDVSTVAGDRLCYAHNCPFLALNKMSSVKHFNSYHSFLFGRPRQ